MPHTSIAELSSTNFEIQSTPKHVAIIMDGNRRWARARGLPPSAGHRQGLRRLIELLPVFAESDVEMLTVFAFSAANWRRDSREVAGLMRLADRALREFLPRALREGVRIEVLGRRDRLPAALVGEIARVMQLTAHGRRVLRIALDYSSRERLVEVARQLQDGWRVEDFECALCAHEHRDVDLMIRTGKEQRLSDFLLWECANAELYFPDLYWPDFDRDAMREAFSWYQVRNRTFGA